MDLGELVALPLFDDDDDDDDDDAVVVGSDVFDVLNVESCIFPGKLKLPQPRSP